MNILVWLLPFSFIIQYSQLLNCVVSWHEYFKAAIIHFYNNNVSYDRVKGVACSDESKENGYLNLQLASALQSFIVSFKLIV